MQNELNSRLVKLEQANIPSGFVLIAVNDGETNEGAYQRCFPHGVKPKVIIYANEQDVRL